MLGEGPFDVIFGDRRLPADEFDRQLFRPVVDDGFCDSLDPKGKVGAPAEVREWLFWSADFSIDATEFVAEADQELAVAFALVEREDQNAREIVGGIFNLNIN